MYVRMYVCMSAYKYVCMYVCMYVCTDICISTYLYRYNSDKLAIHFYISLHFLAFVTLFHDSVVIIIFVPSYQYFIIFNSAVI